MTVEDIIKTHIQDIDNVKRVSENPHDVKFTFISDLEKVREDEIDVYEAWASGDSAKLLNIYSVDDWFNWMTDPIYNRNKHNMFWSLSANEAQMKRTTCGFAHDMVYTMSTKVGKPIVSSGDRETDLTIKEICEESDFGEMVAQTTVPETLIQGTGCFKPCFDMSIGGNPFAQFYKGKDIIIINDGPKNVGVVFKDYYQDGKGQDYVLCDCRYRTKVKTVGKDGSDKEVCASAIEYILCKMSKDGSAEIVPVDSIQETSGYSKEPLVIMGLDYPLAVPNVFYRDNDRFGYGLSVLASKIDVLDDLDQAYSQQSRTTRCSTPVEYYNAEYCEKDRNGNPIRPSRYDRSYVMIDSPLDDGQGHAQNANAIFTTQPKLDIGQYESEIADLKNDCCGSFISPTTMGIGISVKDNGDAQREKEKITTNTRKHIVGCLTTSITRLFRMLLMLKDYMVTGKIDLSKSYDISVSFDELNAPTTEGKINTFLPMYSANACSEKTFVDSVWGSSMSEEQKQAEIEWLKANRKSVGSPKKMDGETRPQKDKVEGISSDNSSYDLRNNSHITPENMKKEG